MTRAPMSPEPFTVYDPKTTPEADRPFTQVARDEYAVFLPHQCDKWVVAQDTDPERVLREAVELATGLYYAIWRLRRIVEREKDGHQDNVPPRP